MNNKIICAVLISGMLCVFNSTCATAANAKITTLKPAGVSFSSEWEKTSTVYGYGNLEIGKLCIGYDTDYINEDYVWTDSYVYNHYSYINNAIAERTSSMATTSNWAKVEVTHYSDFPTYGIIFKDALSNDANNMSLSGFTDTNYK